MLWYHSISTLPNSIKNWSQPLSEYSEIILFYCPFYSVLQHEGQELILTNY